MKAIVKKKINEAVVEFHLEGKDMKEVMLQAQPLLEDDNCWLDGFEEAFVKWETSLAEKDGSKYIYVKKVARKDGRIATRTLGTYKGDYGHFWHKWEEYQPKDAKKSNDISLDDI